MRVLTQLGIIRFTGSDARSFLQGQLSNDLSLLTPGQSQLASCNSAQGRVQAVMTLIERSDGIIALLPAAMVDTIMVRLRKYILRSKVVIDAARLPRLYAANRNDLESYVPLPATEGEHVEHGAMSMLRWRDHHERFLVIRADEDDTTTLANGDDEWMLADIRAGLPQVLPGTHESFVAQMLNLDLLGGISFEKGCYTGQEIVARAHFRGTVKRRMLRFSAPVEPPAPGTRVLANGAHAGDVVMSAATDSGCELLAAIHLTHRLQSLELDTNPAARLTLLELPYSIPVEFD